MHALRVSHFLNSKVLGGSFIFSQKDYLDGSTRVLYFADIRILPNWTGRKEYSPVTHRFCIWQGKS